MTRRIISKRQWDTLKEKGIIISQNAGKNYVISLFSDVSKNYTPDDYRLTAINCTKMMYLLYIREEPHDVEVDDDYNPCEYGYGFYVPEWMFEDRQDDLVDLYKRYGKYKEE